MREAVSLLFARLAIGGGTHGGKNADSRHASARGSQAHEQGKAAKKSKSRSQSKAARRRRMQEEEWCAHDTALPPHHAFRHVIPTRGIIWEHTIPKRWRGVLADLVPLLRPLRHLRIAAPCLHRRGPGTVSPSKLVGAMGIAMLLQSTAWCSRGLFASVRTPVPPVLMSATSTPSSDLLQLNSMALPLLEAASNQVMLPGDAVTITLPDAPKEWTRAIDHSIQSCDGAAVRRKTGLSGGWRCWLRLARSLRRPGARSGAETSSWSAASSMSPRPLFRAQAWSASSSA